VSQQFLKFQKFYLGTGLFSIVYLDDYRDQFTFFQNPKDRAVPSVTPAAQASASSTLGQASLSALGQVHLGGAAGPNHKKNHFEKTPAKNGERKSNNLGAAAAGGARQALSVLPKAPKNIPQAQQQDCGAATSSPFVCPLTNEVMERPVQTKYGIFEGAALVTFISVTQTCPSTGLPLSVQDLRTPPEGFLQRLREYRRSKGLPAAA
jgi:hypothetical protein